MDRAAAKDLLAVDAAYEAEQKRRAKFGLTRASDRWNAAIEATQSALFAICSYQCCTVDEYRLRGAYLLKPEIDDNMDDYHREALALSMAG